MKIEKGKRRKEGEDYNTYYSLLPQTYQPGMEHLEHLMCLMRQLRQLIFPVYIVCRAASVVEYYLKGRNHIILGEQELDTEPYWVK